MNEEKSMPKQHDFLIVGGALVDILTSTPDLDRIDISTHAERLICFDFASKTNLTEMKIHTGGSALNVAITMDCMGARTAMFTALSKSLLGEYVLQRIHNSNINSAYIKRVNTETGVGISLLSGGEKSTLVYHGALDELGKNDVSEPMVKRSKVIIITSITSTKNWRAFKTILQLAKRHHVPIVFAPSMTMIKQFKTELKKLRYTFDITIMNSDEARELTGKSTIPDQLKSLPSRVAVVTKDNDGAYAREGKKIVHVNALPVTVRSTTGAGDVFCGAFTHTYYETKSLSEALKIGVTVAAMKLMRVEAEVQCFPPQILRFLTQWEKKIRVRDV